MRTTICGLGVAIGLIAIIVSVSSHAQARATSQHAPEFANEYIRVSRVTHLPHKTVAVHYVPPALRVCVTAAHERITLADGTTTEEQCKPGDISWWSGGERGGENLTDQPAQFLVIVPVAAQKKLGARR